MRLTINTTPEQDAAIDAARVARLVNGVPQFSTAAQQAEFVIQDALNGLVRQHLAARVQAVRQALDAEPAKLDAVEAELRR